MACKIAQDFEYKGKDWWEWWIWIDASEEELDRIEYVEYTLHPTFPRPVREVWDRASKFRLKSAGWGIFTIYVKLVFKNGATANLEHDLELFDDQGIPTYR